MDIVDKFLDYRKKNDSGYLITSDIDIGQQNLNVITIEILSWLRLEYKRSMWIDEGKKTSLKPLKINMQYSWCVDLCKLVVGESMFRRYFKIESGYFDFSDAITECEKEIIRKKAYENYVPQKNV